MLHKFFEPGDWFAPKSYGYGAGLPIAWQGWVLLAAFILLFTGLALLASTGAFAEAAVAIVLMTFGTIVFATIANKRTRGGWRWRWGSDD